MKGPDAMDIFKLISTAAAVISAYAAWKSIQTEKMVQELQRVKLSAKIQSVTYYTGISDVAYHKFNLVVTNNSQSPVSIKKIGPLAVHGHEYNIGFPDDIIVAPFTPTTITCSVSCHWNDILDGRYPADISVETDRSKHTFHFDESDFRSVFRSEPYKN
jgi:hypothetical protein